ncbi:hypothetical protein ACHHYP_08588 [Achlya hypogyna]|uniref:Uncharacterized protein n=1 Tax=Achlya hypogyna TaxID=1202772 RepID=A0A1V9ZKB9_ACHHY|nr:hypothetical protein ACHHYP_08588 [Achlya hypogyna]
MDPLALLDMERRSGTSNQDVDEFLLKADAVARAVEQIKNGTFDPNDCDVPGYITPEQEAAEEAARLKRQIERQQREEERKRKEKADEHENWWTRAKLRFSIERGDDSDSEGQDQAQVWANRVVQAYKSRDANDYSVWDAWEPKDPVTLEEKARQDALTEKMKNDAFEKSNPEFCAQFQEDLEKRQRSTREKARQAERLRRAANSCYARKQYAAAVDKYMAALADAPHDPVILTNLAQTFLRQELLADALEFCERALFVAPTHLKALSRKAAVLHKQRDLAGAAAVIEEAARLHPTNKDLLEQHSVIVGEFQDAQSQQKLDALLAAPPALATLHLHATHELLARLVDGPLDVDALKALGPVLAADPQARLLFRTRGALAAVAAAADVPEALACLSTAAAADDRTRRVLFHDAVFRTWLLQALATATAPPLWTLLDALVAVPFWKAAVVAAPAVLQQLLLLLAPVGEATVVAAGLLFSLSDAAACRQTLATALVPVVLRHVLGFLRTPAAAAMDAVLGLLLNLSNESVFREVVATEPDVHLEATQLLVAALQATGSDRAAAVLLNLAIDPASAIRADLMTAGGPRVALQLLQSGRGLTDNVEASSVVLQSHCVGLLCRLHSLEDRRAELAHPADLDVLWRVFLGDLARPIDEDMALRWHLRAQTLCHVAWAMELPATKHFFRARGGLATLFGSGVLKTPAPFPPAFERFVANATKCAIALIRDRDAADARAIVDNDGLATLVACMKDAKDDKVAQKNVAILLASLCGMDASIKSRVRELRGIEMMLSICRSMKL